MATRTKLKEWLEDLLSWKKPEMNAKPKEWIWCQKCKRRYKVEPDETPDDCAKRFGLKRVNKRGYVCEDCLK